MFWHVSVCPHLGEVPWPGPGSGGVGTLVRSRWGGYPTSGTPCQTWLGVGYPTSGGVFDTPRSVCFLRSRRRTFLLHLWKRSFLDIGVQDIVTCVEWKPSAEYTIVIGTEGGTVHVQDVRKGVGAQLTTYPHTRPVTRMQFANHMCVFSHLLDFLTVSFETFQYIFFIVAFIFMQEWLVVISVRRLQYYGTACRKWWSCWNVSYCQNIISFLPPAYVVPREVMFSVLSTMAGGGTPHPRRVPPPLGDRIYRQVMPRAVRLLRFPAGGLSCWLSFS